MAKDTFIVYISFYRPISILSDKQLGRLFRAIFKYHLGEVVNVEEDIRMAFEFFKNQFEIDESKYQAKIKRDVENGHKGGNPNFKKGKTNPYYKDNKKITQDNPGLCKDNPNITQDKAINDNVNDNDNDNDIITPCSRDNSLGTTNTTTGNDGGLQVYSSYIEESKQDQNWLDIMCMNFQVNVQTLTSYMDEFRQDCLCRGVDDRNKTLRDFKQHFNNWLRIRMCNEIKNNNGNRQSNGAAATREQREAEAAQLVAEILARDNK